MSRSIDMYSEERGGKRMTYATPGDTVPRLEAEWKTPDTWHRFLLWEKRDWEAHEQLFEEVAAWCLDNKVRRPTMKFVRGCGYPILVATASHAKATLFKLTFGGTA